MLVALTLVVRPARKGNWRISLTPQLHKALNDAFWIEQGFESLVQRYLKIRQDWRTAVCGPACTVV